MTQLSLTEFFNIQEFDNLQVENWDKFFKNFIFEANRQLDSSELAVKCSLKDDVIEFKRLLKNFEDLIYSRTDVEDVIKFKIENEETKKVFNFKYSFIVPLFELMEGPELVKVFKGELKSAIKMLITKEMEMMRTVKQRMEKNPRLKKSITTMPALISKMFV